MHPIVTPAEMAAIDADAAEDLDTLIARAATAVAAAAIGMLGGRYGRRVVIVAGPGNNGADGRVAAELLSRQGIRVDVLPAGQPLPARSLDRADLVIDAAYGTGLRRPYHAPDVGAVPVLAVDIPSGVDGLTGVVHGAPVRADHTLTFAAHKPGLLLGDGPDHTGSVTVADIGLGSLVDERARAWLLGPADLASRWPAPPRQAHKWQRAVWVVGGSGTMTGAPALAAAAALRAAAGYVAVSTPGGDPVAGPPLPIEAVVRPLGPSSPSPDTWAATVLADHERFGAIVLGPGLTPHDDNRAAVRAVARGTDAVGLVIDAGALDAVADDPTALHGRRVPAVLTPHDGELARLLGRPPGLDRFDEARRAAAELQAVVLLKGPTTVVAHPDGGVLVSAAGDDRLATAGTGDVLSGVIGAGLAAGLDPFHAAALGAELHGRAAGGGRRRGLVAGDLPALVGDYCAGLV